MEALFGVRFLASEHSTGKKHGGRIDSLGLDENGSPVIFEYKRSVNETSSTKGFSIWTGCSMSLNTRDSTASERSLLPRRE
jgi:RecB family endonuclease NucS